MDEKNIQKTKLIYGLRVCAAVLAAYVLLVCVFRFLAGDQFLYRESKGNIMLQPAFAGAVELTDGVVVEQSFYPNIQRLQSVSVQWATYYRANSGHVALELFDLRDNTLLMSGTFAAEEIQEGQSLTISPSEPIEGLYGAPLLLRIHADSEPGHGVTPLMADITLENSSLSINGAAAEGTICFSASGEDYIWTGLHYWKITAISTAALSVILLWVLHCYIHEKHSYILYMIAAMKRYKFLIEQLVSRDFKTKYKRSVLGVMWSFLNPLLMMMVQYVVFSNIFRTNIERFPAYLLTGIVCFNFFSEACSMSLVSIIINAGLITKVYVPKYIYPLTRVMSSVINLVISLVPLALVCALTGVRLHRATVLVLFFLLCLTVFSLGLGLMLSALMVFFRDTQFLWNVVNMIWMYATPLFYPESIIPDRFHFVLDLNPIYYFIKGARMCILNGQSPEPLVYVKCMFVALASLLIGATIFGKTQDKFALYL